MAGRVPQDRIGSHPPLVTTKLLLYGIKWKTCENLRGACSPSVCGKHNELAELLRLLSRQ